MKKHKTLLITGCGRSGTNYISDFLKANGLDIGHESEGKDGISSWLMTVEDDNPPFGPSAVDYSFEHTIHQVRNPIDTISSGLTIKEISWDYIKKYIPIGAGDSTLLKASKYWYYWNVLAEKKAEFTYKVEEIELVLPKIINLAGKGKLKKESLFSVSKKTNSREHKSITIDEIKKEDAVLCKNIIALANRYGYKIS